MNVLRRIAERANIAAKLRRRIEDIVGRAKRELESARREMAEKAKTAGIGAGLMSVSAVTGLLTLGSLTAVLILALSLVLPPWLAALVVTVFWGALTAIFGFIGTRKLGDAMPLIPEKTIERAKEERRSALASERDGNP